MARMRFLPPCLLVAAALAAAPVSAGEFVGIPGRDFASHYRPQRASMWCWASCVEMALSYAGIEVPQDTIVARTQGEGVNVGALPRDVVRSANGLFVTTTGEAALVSSQFLRGVPPATVLYNHLRRRAPAILLYERADGDGHAVVLTGMEVAVRADRGLDVEAFHVFDPQLGAATIGGPATDALAYRRIVAAIETERGLAIESGTIDGVVLMDSTRLDPRRDGGR